MLGEMARLGVTLKENVIGTVNFSMYVQKVHADLLAQNVVTQVRGESVINSRHS